MPDDETTEHGPDATLLAFSVAELLAPIPETRYVGGLIFTPCGGYAVASGVLGSGKTTFAFGVSVTRATGYDILNLDPEGRMDLQPGPAVLVTYEDSAPLVDAKFRRVVQHAHEAVRASHGPAAAAGFLDLIAKNSRHIVLTGRPGTQLICRSVHGEPQRNSPWVDELIASIETFARSDVLITIDPLRLAFGGGSQNDDFGADLGVCLLNELATALPDSGVLVVSHTTKAAATGEQSGDKVSLAYSTAGSALWSQHARSNLHIGKPTTQELRRLAPGFLTDEEIEKRRVAAVTHARLSHGEESDTRYFAMRGGVLVPIPTSAQGESATQKLRRGLSDVAKCIGRIEGDGLRATASALEDDADLCRRWTRKGLRDLVKHLLGQGWLDIDGTTSNRRLSVSDAGRAQLPPSASAKEAA